MKLSDSVVNDFAKLVAGTAKGQKRDSFVYGTVASSGEDGVSVIFDGAEAPTPVSTTVDVAAGHRVLMLIKNHTATVVSNITSPTVNGVTFTTFKNGVMANFDGITAKYADLGGFISVAGDTEHEGKTSAAGGHAHRTSLYVHNSDDTYEYEAGLKGDARDSAYVAFYIKRMPKGQAWSSSSYMFYVNNSGKLYAQNADITGKITATSGSFKGSIDADAFKATYSDSNLTMTAQLTGGGLYITSILISPSTKRYLLLDPSTTIWRNAATDTGQCAYVTSRGFAISDSGVKGDGNARVNILATEISQYDASGNHGTRIHGASVDVGNSTTNGRTGRLTSSDAGNIGIYDADEEEYIIYSSLSHAVFIPHPTTLESVATYNGFFKPIGSYGTDGRRVAYVSARVDGSNYQFRVSGQWGATGSNYSVKTIWSASTSDIRLKENIKPTDVVGLKAVNKMLVRQFDWKRDGRHQDIGFVADELEKIDPNLALGGGYDEDGNMDEKQVNTYQVVAYLVKAVQELSAQVHELKGDDDGR